MCVPVWRLEVDFGCLPTLLFTLFLRQSLTEPGAFQLDRPGSSGIFLAPPSGAGITALGLQPCLEFYTGAGDPSTFSCLHNKLSSQPPLHGGGGGWVTSSWYLQSLPRVL